MNRHGLMTVVALMVLVFLGTGCVEIHQVVHMQHDGSGRIVERIRILPRAIRLLEKNSKQAGAAGKGGELHILLTDSALEERMKTFGKVVVKSKKLTTLPDGSKQMDVEYTFKNINGVGFWVTPIFKGNDPKRSGRMKLGFSKIIYKGHYKKYYKADQMKVRVAGGNAPARRKYSSPADLKKVEHITSVFQDMLVDMKLKIEVVAPYEEYEGQGIKGVPRAGNHIIILNIQGGNVVGASGIIQQFLAGEVGGRADAWGGTWKKMEDGLPDTYTPYACGYGGIYFNFLKETVTAAPVKKAVKKGAKK